MKTFLSLEERPTVQVDALPDKAPGKKSAESARKAAMLSVIPGLGQLHNGETGKGILFLAVALLNTGLLLGIAFNGAALKVVSRLAGLFHLQPNWALTRPLDMGQLGSPFSLIYLGLIVSFAVYAARDAYDHALIRLQGRSYPRFYLGLPEAASGSYLGHFSVMAAFFLTILFVVIPQPPKEQVTEIELVREDPPPKPPEPEKPKPEVKQPEPPRPRENPPEKAPPKPAAPKPTPVAVAVPTDEPSPLTTDQSAPVPEPTPAPAPAAAAGSPGGSGTGAPAGDSDEVDFGPYMSELQRRIKKQWFPPKGNESKRVTVRFKVRKNGEVASVKLVQSSGLSIADDAAVAAVENASPFGQLPSGSPDEVEIKFTFDYNIFSAGRRGAVQEL